MTQVQDRQCRLEIIKDAFEGDDSIYTFFDPNVQVNSLEELAGNILSKIDEHDELFECEFVQTASGYVFYLKDPRLLISFGCRKSARSGDFFSEITEVVGSCFACALWSRNTRAINWLRKNGMTINNTKDNITILSICH